MNEERVRRVFDQIKLPPEQRHTQLRLPPPDDLAHRRLGDVELAGGQGDVPPPGHGAEVAQRQKVHGGGLLSGG